MKSVRLLVPAVLAALSVACQPPPKAPEEVSELTRFLFREWSHEDPSVMQDGIDQLDRFLREEIDFKGDLNQRSMELGSIKREDLDAVDWPKDQDPAKTIGLAVMRESRWPVGDHARFQAQSEQLAAEPSASKYARRFVEPGTPECFIAGDCAVLGSENDVTRKNFLMEVDIVLKKHFRWVELSDGRRAVVARSWVPRVFEAKGEGRIAQSYAVDVWIEQEGGRTWRFQALYQHTEFGFDVDDSTQLTVVAGATDEAFEKGDKAIEDKFHKN